MLRNWKKKNFFFVRLPYPQTIVVGAANAQFVLRLTNVLKGSAAVWRHTSMFNSNELFSLFLRKSIPNAFFVVVSITMHNSHILFFFWFYHVHTQTNIQLRIRYFNVSVLAIIHTCEWNEAKEQQNNKMRSSLLCWTHFMESWNIKEVNINAHSSSLRITLSKRRAPPIHYTYTYTRTWRIKTNK